MGGSRESGCFEHRKTLSGKSSRRAEDTLGAGLEHKEGSDKLAKEAKNGANQLDRGQVKHSRGLGGEKRQAVMY